MNEKKSKEHTEEWVEGIMASIDGMHRAEAPDALFERIEARIEKKTAKHISLQKLIWVGAAACLLLGLNIASLVNIQNQNSLVGDLYSAAEVLDLTIYE